MTSSPGILKTSGGNPIIHTIPIITINGGNSDHTSIDVSNNTDNSSSSNNNTDNNSNNSNNNTNNNKRTLGVTPSVQFSDPVTVRAAEKSAQQNATTTNATANGLIGRTRTFVTANLSPAVAAFNGCRNRTLKKVHCRFMLITICFLVVVECACVLSELMVDLHGIKIRFENEAEEINKFVVHFRRKHPEAFEEVEIKRMKDFMHLLKTSASPTSVDDALYHICNPTKHGDEKNSYDKNRGFILGTSLRPIKDTYDNTKTTVIPSHNPSSPSNNNIGLNTIQTIENKNYKSSNGDTNSKFENFQMPPRQNESQVTSSRRHNKTNSYYVSSTTKTSTPVIPEVMTPETVADPPAQIPINSGDNSRLTTKGLVINESNLPVTSPERQKSDTQNHHDAIKKTTAFGMTNKTRNDKKMYIDITPTTVLNLNMNTRNVYISNNNNNTANNNTGNNNKLDNTKPSHGNNQTFITKKLGSQKRNTNNSNNENITKSNVTENVDYVHNSSDAGYTNNKQTVEQSTARVKGRVSKTLFSNKNTRLNSKITHSSLRRKRQSVDKRNHSTDDKKSVISSTENLFVLAINDIKENFFLIADLLPEHVKNNGSRHSKYMDEYKNIYKTSKVLHYTSLTILGIMVVETAVKLFCAGCDFFKKKLEVFDAIVVVSSFCLDVMFLDSRWYETGKDATALLVLLLPWRVVRIVNSFIMTIKHKHQIQMMNLKRGKKKAELKTAKVQTLLNEIRKDVQLLVNLCKSVNMEETTINACLYGKGRNVGATQTVMETCASLMLISTLGKTPTPQEDEIYGTLIQEALEDQTTAGKSPEKQQQEEAAIDAAIALDDKIEAKRKSSKRKSGLSIRLKKALVQRSHTLPRRCASLEIPDGSHGLEIDGDNGVPNNVFYINQDTGDIVSEGDYVIIDSEGRYYIRDIILPEEDGGSHDATRHQQYSNPTYSDL